MGAGRGVRRIRASLATDMHGSRGSPTQAHPKSHIIVATASITWSRRACSDPEICAACAQRAAWHGLTAPLQPPLPQRRLSVERTRIVSGSTERTIGTRAPSLRSDAHPCLTGPRGQRMRGNGPVCTRSRNSEHRGSRGSQRLDEPVKKLHSAFASA